VTNPADKCSASPLKHEPLANLQARITELEQENARLQAEVAANRECEENLRNAETHYHTIVHFAYDWIYWEAPDGRLHYVSPSCERITGYTPAEFMTNPALLAGLILPDDAGIWANHKHQPGVTARSEFQFRIRRRDGEIRWIEHICQPVVDDAGVFCGFRVNNRDISRRKKAEADLRESEALLANRLFIEQTNDKLKQHVEKLSTLNLIAQTVTTITDLETVLGVVAGTMLRLFDAYATDISLLDSRETRLTVFAPTAGAENWKKKKNPLVRLVDDPAAQQVIKTGRPLLVPRATTNPLTEAIHPILQAKNIQSLLSVPMLARGKTIGLITIYTDQPHRDFSPAEVSLAETIAGQVAGAVETARLFAQEQERRREAERRRLIAESLADILTVLNANQPLADTLDYIAGQANRLLGTDASAIYRQGENPDEPFLVLAAQGYCAEQINAVNLPLDHSVLRQALAGGQPLALADRAAVPAPNGQNNPALGETGLATLPEQFQALLAVPLFVKNTPYGGIMLYYRAPHPFSAEEIALAVIFSNQVTLAIENAGLRLEAERAAVAAERNRLARDLHDSVTQTLFSVAAIAEALPRVWESHPAESQKALTELRRLTQGALAEMRNLLLELRPAVLVEKPMGELLRQLADAMMGRTRMQVTTTVVDERELPPEAKIGLYRIAQESLNNVTKHARAGQVKIGLYYEPEQVELNIIDNGRGFDPATIAPGQLGVAIMAERAAAIGAVFEITSQPDQGTQITVIWPDRP
jgi:PAS domain S-box-containing protein